MSDKKDLIANLSPEKRAELLAKLSKNKKAEIEIDFSENFEYKFASENPFDIKPSNTSIDNPGPDCIQIVAKASSLNFRDVMIASKQYPSSPGVPANMGSDYSGIVVKVGENIKDFKAGDEVIAIHVGHMENDGTIRDNCHFIKIFNIHKFSVCLKPKNLTFIEACCIPTVFLTSYIGLVKLANLAKNENVLIHTASGGVGLSAVQIAKWKDANIYATAGTEEKRTHLKQYGIEKIYNSRTTEFAELISNDKNKIDVVLNTLSGDLMKESLKLLSPFGRFIHIDKKDIALNSPLDLSLFINGISFQFLDISLLFVKPDIMNNSLKEIVNLFEEEAFNPISHVVFPIQELKKAITIFSRGTHIGKIVLSY